MEKLRGRFAVQRARELEEQNVAGQVCRLFICTNADEIFGTDIVVGEVRKELKKRKLNNLAEKIITIFPLFYKLLCILKINKVFAKIMER